MLGEGLLQTSGGHCRVDTLTLNPVSLEAVGRAVL